MHLVTFLSLITFIIYVLLLILLLPSVSYKRPVIDFKQKVARYAGKGWRGERLKWYLVSGRLSKAFHPGFYSSRQCLCAWNKCQKWHQRVMETRKNETTLEGKSVFVMPRRSLLQKVSEVKARGWKHQGVIWMEKNLYFGRWNLLQCVYGCIGMHVFNLYLCSL